MELRTNYKLRIDENNILPRSISFKNEEQFVNEIKSTRLIFSDEVNRTNFDIQEIHKFYIHRSKYEQVKQLSICTYGSVENVVLRSFDIFEENKNIILEKENEIDGKVNYKLNLENIDSGIIYLNMKIEGKNYMNKIMLL